jgi:hypothetical protein
MLFSSLLRRRARASSGLRPAAHVVAACQGDRTVLLDYRRARYYGLDEVGSRIWSLLAQGESLDGIVSRLGAEYDAPAERLREDTDRLVEQLRTLGLLGVA